MGGAVVILLLWSTAAAIPPLTDQERSRLDAAVDLHGDLGDAFDALIENVRRWTPGITDAPIIMEPDFEAMLDAPQAYRGRLCSLAGRLQQETWLEAPHQSVAEWFLRTGSGRPILVYVAGLDRDHRFKLGRPVVIRAWFYKRVDEVAQDRRTHRYPAFVGALPQFGAADPAWGQAWVVAIPVAVMLLVFLALLIYARRGGRPTRPRVGLAAGPSSDGQASLPGDAAEALAELRRRAEAGH